MSVCLIDANSVGNAANAATRLTAGDIETQAIFGSIKSIRELIIKFRASPIALWDGRAQWRYDLYPEYKAKRVIDPTKKLKPYEIAQQKAKESYVQQRPHIITALTLLGVRQVIPENDEADDLAGYLSKDFAGKGRKVTVVSRDKDWLQLVDNGVDWFNPVDKELVTRRTFAEYTGYKHAYQFVAEKCLVGDSSDNISGVPGIGEKAAPLIMQHFGSAEKAVIEIRACGDAWEAPASLKRYRKKLIEFALNVNGATDIYQRNQKLMNLLNVSKPTNLKVVRKDLDESGFEEFCQEFAFHSIIRNLDEWLRPFRG